MKFDILGLEAVGRGIAAGACGGAQADLDRQIENEGQIWREVADGDPLEAFDERGSTVPSAP